MDILGDLNKPQQEAVLTTEGPVLILAGAGSGKTKALTHRIAYLIKEKKVSPYHILAFTFTNKAAEEMTIRLAQLISNPKSEIRNPKQILNPNDKNSKQVSNFDIRDSNLEVALRLPWMGTFHSICVKILRREIHQLGYKSSFTIYDETDSLILIKRIMKELGIDPKQYNPNAVKHFISSAKNELIDQYEYQNYIEGYFQEIVGKVFEKYQHDLKEANALDFDDLLMKTVQLFEQFPDVLEKYQNIFQYIFIDEYQDTNKAQYQMVKLLAQKNRNICVVGDDYQAIYGFRGANFRNILNFERDYPDAKVIKLEQNYRSTKTILNAADKIIKENINRTEKKLWTENEEGAPITIYEATDEHDEVEFIVREIQALQSTPEVTEFKQLGSDNDKRYAISNKLNNFVILYRTNAQSRVIEEVFLQYGIPYRLIGAFRFYERKEVKDIISYLKLINNPFDKVSLERVINTPARGIGAKTLSQISRYKIQDTNKSQTSNFKLQNFFQMMDGFRIKALDSFVLDLIEYVAQESGYKKYLLDGTDEGEARWANIEELKSVAQNTKDLEQFLEKVSLVSDMDTYNQNKDAITMMTLHNAKGLEFPVVFIAGMEEGLFPHSRSIMEPMEMEEERRLCYVGITRAKKRLYMTHSSSRLIYGQIQSNMRSRFIDSLPEHLIDKI